MDRMARGLVWKGGAITLILLVLLVVLWANLNSMITENCTNRVISEIPSPGGTKKVVIFQRNCGIDAAISTQVSLLGRTETLQNRKGNLFIATGNARRVGVDIKWKSPTAIDLSYKTRREVLRKTSQLNGVTISYRNANASAPNQ